MKNKRIIGAVLGLLIAAMAITGGIIYQCNNKDASAAMSAPDANGLRWSFTVENGKATNLYYASDFMDSKIPTGVLTVPSTVLNEDTNVEYPVVSIGYKIMGESSFFTGSVNVTSTFTVDLSQMTSLKKINGYAFYNEDSKLDKMISIQIPNTLEEIGDYAFSGSKINQLFDLPFGVTTVGTGAFKDCDAVNLKVNNPNTQIQDTTKMGCTIVGFAPSSAKDYADATGSTFTENTTKTTQKISIDANGGAGTAGLLSSYLYAYDGMALPSLARPAREHYDFLGFNTTSSNSGKMYYGAADDTKTSVAPVDAQTFIASDFQTSSKLYAIWNPTTYDITFETKGGAFTRSAVVPATYTFGTGAVLPVTDTTDIKRSGYYFSGWYDAWDTENEKVTGNRVREITTTDFNNKTLYANWTAKSYIIDYNLGGASYFDMTDDAVQNRKQYETFTHTDVAGTTMEVMPDNLFARTGYDFIGWYTNTGDLNSKVTSIDCTAVTRYTLFALWTPHVYSLDFDAQGGKITEMPPASYTYDTETILPTKVVKTGHTFDGWYTSGNATGTAITKTEKTQTGDMTYYASWKANQYDITYHLDGGEITGNYADSYTYGVATSLPYADQMVKKGYTFTGWYVNPQEYSSKTDEVNVLSTTGYEVTATWKVNDYTIAYDAQGGTINDYAPAGYTFGRGADLPSDVTKKGSKFLGWYETSAATGSAVTKVSKETAGNLTFYANWEKETYQITYDVKGGTINGDYVTEYQYGDDKTLPTVDKMSREGYDFSGWLTVNNDMSVDYELKNQTGDKNLYADWTPIKYNVTLNANGGVASKSEMAVKYGTPYATLPTPTWSGHNFLGWYDEDGKLVDSGYTMNYARDSVLKAVWGDGVFTVAFNANGGTCSKDSMGATFGTAYGELPVPTRAKYSFVGWYTGNTLITAESIVNLSTNVVLTAKWASNSNSIAIDCNWDSSIDDNESYPDITNITLPANKASEVAAWYRGSASGYFYNKLNAEEKKIYAALFARYQNGSFIGQSTYFTLYTGVTEDTFKAECENTANAFTLDHPEFSWIKQVGFSVVVIEGGFKAVFRTSATYDSEMAKAAAQNTKYGEGTFTAAIRGINVKKGDTDAQIAVKIHDYIVKNVTYATADADGTYSNATRDPAYVLFNSKDKSAVCVGYAKLFQVFCRYYGVECVMDGSETHVWDMVKVGSKWYGVDCTWDDSMNVSDYLLAGTTADWLAEKEHTSNKTDRPAMSATDYVMKITVGKMVYKVADIQSRNAQVASVTASGKKATTLSVPATAKLGGSTYKITGIGKSAFAKCTKLKKVTIGANVTSIGENAFKNDKKLASILIKSKKLTTVKKAAFKGTSKKLKVKVPSAKVASYSKKIKKAGNKKVRVTK